MADGTKWALLIGINQYENPDLVTPLQFAVNDVRLLAKTLIENCGFPEEQVYLLCSDTPDQKPTRGRIGNRLNFLLGKVKPDDTFFFFFSGHGMHSKEENTSYLLTYEADPSSKMTLELTCLGARKVQEWLSQIPAAVELAVYDMCRHDPVSAKGAADNILTADLARDLQLKHQSPKGEKTKPAVPICACTIYACQQNQRSYEWKEKQQGLFTYFLVQGLQGAAADNGLVTLTSLQEYLAREVPQRAKYEKGVDQQPWFTWEGPGAKEVQLARYSHLARSSVTDLQSISAQLKRSIMGYMDVKGKEPLEPGPVGEYLEVVDVDPVTDSCFAPDTNNHYLSGTQSKDTYENDPQFHQQLAYAVAMRTIRQFEKALGRTSFWAPHLSSDEDGWRKSYVQRLRIYPHALLERNAYYSPEKRALLFGYFPASTFDPDQPSGKMVYTCLSPDLITQQTVYALLHGMHRRFSEPSNPDVLAFLEAFPDIIALLQNFSVPDILRPQIVQARDDQSLDVLLRLFAYASGQTIASVGALRSALGEFRDGKWESKAPDPTAIDKLFEPHARGSILVAAVFDAFMAILKSRVGDLLEIGPSGTAVHAGKGVNPNLVDRITKEAAASAEYVLRMCIRALDYCPPADLTFGEYLRAVITADFDLTPNDEQNHRTAFVESFRNWGICPDLAQDDENNNYSIDVLKKVRNGGIDRSDIRKLLWKRSFGPDYRRVYLPVRDAISKHMPNWKERGRSEEVFNDLARSRAILHQMLGEMGTGKDAAELRSLLRLDPALPFEIHSLRPVRRIGPDGEWIEDIVIEITQSRPGYLDENVQKEMDARWKEKNKVPGTPPADFRFRGGCTLLVDMETGEVRYCIYKNLYSENRLARQRAFQASQGGSLRSTYFSSQLWREPFAFLHRAADTAEEEAEWLM